jgi:hypothetical protein
MPYRATDKGILSIKYLGLNIGITRTTKRYRVEAEVRFYYQGSTGKCPKGVHVGELMYHFLIHSDSL